jgi:hypothetical protein
MPPWIMLTAGGGVEPCCEYVWNVDSTLPETDKAVLRLFDYSIPDGQTKHVLSKRFTLTKTPIKNTMSPAVHSKIKSIPELVISNTGTVTVHNGETVTNVRLFDIRGRQIGERFLKGKNNIGKIQPGIYVYRIVQNDGGEIIGSLIFQQ